MKVGDKVNIELDHIGSVFDGLKCEAEIIEMKSGKILVLADGHTLLVEKHEIIESVNGSQNL